MRPRSFLFLSATFILAGAISVTAQVNLLVNPNADLGSNGWRAFGNSTIDEFDGKKVFTIRDGQTHNFSQDVEVSEFDTGKYALFIGRGSSERSNGNGVITGLPYLYGYMLKTKDRSGAKINGYSQGQQMLGRSSKADDWVTMYGIFAIPHGTVAIRFFMMQAERSDSPQNGSAARFKDLGLYLFKTEQEALKFVKTYDKNLAKEQ